MPIKSFIKSALFAAMLGASALGYGAEPYDNRLKQMNMSSVVSARVEFWAHINNHQHVYDTVWMSPWMDLRDVASKAAQYSQTYSDPKTGYVAKYTLTTFDLVKIKTAIATIQDRETKANERIAYHRGILKNPKQALPGVVEESKKMLAIGEKTAGGLMQNAARSYLAVINTFAELEGKKPCHFTYNSP